MLHHIHRLRSRHFLETCATEYRSPLRWFERYRSLRSAFRAGCPSLMANRTNWVPESKIALRLALLTAFRGVLKLLVVKEKLLTSRNHKLGSTVDAL